MIKIVTVNHDSPRFIELCIKAVRHRTLPPYEHVIIDNGSKPETIAMLEQFSRARWITLLRRKIHKSAGGHAQSLDWYLQRQDFDRICLMDSDAYPVKKDWLTFLDNKLVDADAVGFAHFRDASLLHPACMLFKYKSYARAGYPTFAISGQLRAADPRFHRLDVFNDTGMIVCKRMLQTGSKLHPISEQGLGELVKHRWRATRYEVATGNKIDDTPKEVYAKETEEWFQHPAAKESLCLKL